MMEKLRSKFFNKFNLPTESGVPRSSSPQNFKFQTKSWQKNVYHTLFVAVRVFKCKA